MRLLFLSNLFPPVDNGGYELWCQEVAEGLRDRGHNLVVLTGRRRAKLPVPPDPDWVHRNLFMEMEFASTDHALKFFTERRGRQQANLDTLQRLIQEFTPDAVMVWGMWNLSRALPAMAEALLPRRVVYFFGDYWPILPNQHRFFWEAAPRSWAARIPKSLLRPLAMRLMDAEPDVTLQFQHVLFPSAFMQEEYVRHALPFLNARVILGAVDTRPFLQDPPPTSTDGDGTLRLLYVGRLSPEKGVPIVIQAVETLVKGQSLKVHLTIVGSGESGYVESLHRQVQAAGLEQSIQFSAPVSKEEMPALYRCFDAVVFPSTWQEPFGRVLVEALASGTAVIASATGGATEIIQAGRNGLTFTAGDVGDLVVQISRLVEQDGLRLRLVEQGRRDALEKFDIQRMVTEIEGCLQSLVNVALPVD